VARNYTHVFAPATAFGKNVLPRLAALLDCAQVSTSVRRVADTFTRPIYAGNAIATVQSSDPIRSSARGRPTSRRRARRLGGDRVAGAGGRLGAVEIRRPRDRQERPAELQGAKWCLRGRGMGSARTSGCSSRWPTGWCGTRASRAAVDAGFAPNDWQVVRRQGGGAAAVHAVGISGAIQHLAGMKTAR